MRDLQYAIDAERSVFAYRMQQLLLRSERLVQQRDELPADVFQQQVHAIEQACNALLGILVRTPIARRLQQRYVLCLVLRKPLASVSPVRDPVLVR